MSCVGCNVKPSDVGGGRAAGEVALSIPRALGLIRIRSFSHVNIFGTFRTVIMHMEKLVNV